MPPPSRAVLARRTVLQHEERRIRISGIVRGGYSHEAIAREENLSREPALRLAARGIENGKLNAIVPLLKVLERLDKYRAVVHTLGMHDRLMKKINGTADRIGIPIERTETEPEPAADVEGRENLEGSKSGWFDL